MTAPLPEEPPAKPKLWTPAPDLMLALECGVIGPDLLEGRPPETRARLRTGTWKSYDGVVVMHNGPLTVEQSEWVALLRCGLGAVLAAASAMARGGVKVDPPPRPQVVIPWWRTGLATDLADVRRSRLMSAQKVHPTRQPPQFRLARATVDAASLARRPDDVRALLCAPVQQRRLLPGQLRSVVGRLGPVSGRALMLRTLDDLELGAQSTHELRFTRGLRRAGLPQPGRQSWRQHRDGRWYLDCEWDDYGLHVDRRAGAPPGGPVGRRRPAHQRAGDRRYGATAADRRLPVVRAAGGRDGSGTAGAAGRWLDNLSCRSERGDQLWGLSAPRAAGPAAQPIKRSAGR